MTRIIIETDEPETTTYFDLFIEGLIWLISTPFVLLWEALNAEEKK